MIRAYDMSNNMISMESNLENRYPTIHSENLLSYHNDP